MLVKPTPDLDSQQQIALHLEIQQALMERLRENLFSGSNNVADVNLPLVDQNLLAIDQQQEVVTTGVLGHFPKDEYEQFFADVWVGVVLTLMVLSCVCCMCSCLLYHKFQQWKRSVLENRSQRNDVEIGGDVESLPSYTIVSGLPSYDEALEQLRQIKASKPAVKDVIATNDKSVEASVTSGLTPISIISNSDMTSWQPHTPPTPNHIPRLSVVDLFQIYRNTNVPMTSSLAAVINENKT